MQIRLVQRRVKSSGLIRRAAVCSTRIREASRWRRPDNFPAWRFYKEISIIAEFLASQCIETIMIYLNTFQYITMIHLGTWCHLLGILQS